MVEPDNDGKEEGAIHPVHSESYIDDDGDLIQFDSNADTDDVCELDDIDEDDEEDDAYEPDLYDHDEWFKEDIDVEWE